MHFRCMFAYIFLMKQLNFLSTLCFFLYWASCKRARSVSWATALWVILNSLDRGREEKKAWSSNRRDPQEKWEAACKTEQTCTHSAWVTCLLLPEDLVLLLPLPVSQKANPIKQKFLVLQQLQQGKPVILPCGQTAATPTTKETAEVLHWKCKEVEPIILPANDVKVGIAQYHETGTSLAIQKRL